MIMFLFYFFGFILYFLDIVIFPTLTSYHFLIDTTLFYSFFIFEIKKDKSLPYIVVLIWLKAILLPRENVISFIFLCLFAIYFFITTLRSAKISKHISIGFTGFVFFSLEYLLFKHISFLNLILSLSFQYFIWLCIIPILSLLTKLYDKNMKDKGVYV